MCFICDGGTLEELHRRIDDAIDGRGWFISAVEAGPGVPAWAYTIGLSERFGHPELVVVDPQCFACAADLINALAEDVARGVVHQAGDTVGGQGRLVARIGAVHPEEWNTDRFNGWLWYYEEKPWQPPPARALQVIWQSPGSGFQDEAWNDRWRSDCLTVPPAERASPSPALPARRRNRSERRALQRRRRRRHS